MNNTSASSRAPAQAQTPLLNFTELVILSILYILIAIVAIVGNVLIIIVFSKKRRLRTRTNYFIIGLATSDILVGAVTLPLWMTVVYFLHVMKYIQMQMVYDVFMPLDILSGMLSILHLMTISLERLYAIAFPLHHRTSRARTNCVALAVLWSMAAAVASLSFVIPKGPEWKGTLILYSTLGFFVPFFIILVAYLSIYVIVKRRTYTSRKHTHVVRKESRTAVTIFVLIVLFLITWLPFFSLNLVIVSCMSCTQVIMKNYYILLIFKALHYSGSALNPIVYSARMPEFRQPLKTLIMERRITESVYGTHYRKDSMVSLRSMRKMSEARKISDYQLNSRKESVVSVQSRMNGRKTSEYSSPYSSRKDSMASQRSSRERKTSDYLSPNNFRKNSAVSERSFPGRKMSDYLSPYDDFSKDPAVSGRPFPGRKTSDYLSPNNFRKDLAVSERSFSGRKMSDYLSPYDDFRKDPEVSASLIRESYI